MAITRVGIAGAAAAYLVFAPKTAHVVRTPVLDLSVMLVRSVDLSGASSKAGLDLAVYVDRVIDLTGVRVPTEES